ncbi:MAG: L,D-transpeptidase [Hyphomicrobiales bacterium]|nr:L,D-transpeptidase [Hyphomicrobiales bacterium]
MTMRDNAKNAMLRPAKPSPLLSGAALALGLWLGCAAGAAAAPREVASANLGGGFIQMLVTGSTGHAAPPQVSAAPPQQILPRFARQQVPYVTNEAPGTLIVDTPHRYLYLVEGHGLAMRFGVGVGRPGFTWSGVERISRKQKWPTWTPPASMRRRRPNLPLVMPGGESNPLGARALYLGHTEYRIHGTNEPWSIGTNLSSGCIRMMNADVRYLYRKVDVGTKVVILPG